MKRLIIICEGETEKAFCNTILSPYFINKGIFIEAPLIKHSNGGIVRWEKLKKQIETTLVHEPSAYVTMLIDYYGLYHKYGFPGWTEAEQIVDKNDRMKYLENQMFADINEKVRYRFVPYLQLHEFEGILFCNVDVFKQIIPANELLGMEELEQVVADYPNPEMINTCKETSPSHRLQRIILGYNKIVYGNIIAECIGLTTIRQKCPLFDSWLTFLEQLPELKMK